MNPESQTKKLSGFYYVQNGEKGYVECLKYMHMIQDGSSIHSIHVKYRINGDRLRVLWHSYQSEGRSGLQKKKNIKADYALKKKIRIYIATEEAKIFRVR